MTVTAYMYIVYILHENNKITQIYNRKQLN